MKYKYNIDGVWLNTIELASYIGISRQWLYIMKQKMSIEEIIKIYKKNDITPMQVKKRKNDIIITQEELNEVKDKINDAIKLINNLIANWYKGDFCLNDLEQIKEKLK